MLAGKLMGEFQGAGSLSVAAGATLVLGGSGVQVAPPAVGAAGGTLEVEPDADVSLVLAGAPALQRLAVGAGASLDVSIDATAARPAPRPSQPDALAATRSRSRRARRCPSPPAAERWRSPVHDVLSGSGTLDASLENGGGTVEPSGALHVTGDYTQSAAATLALDLRSAADGDSLRVEGAAALGGHARGRRPVHAGEGARPNSCSAPGRSRRERSRRCSRRSRAGLDLGSRLRRDGRHTRRHRREAAPPASLTRPSLRPAVPVVGGRTRCLPGKWTGAPALTYQWLRGARPIAHATAQLRRVTPADRGRALACRVTATAAGGARTTVGSKPARARAGSQHRRGHVQAGRQPFR